MSRWGDRARRRCLWPAVAVLCATLGWGAASASADPPRGSDAAKSRPGGGPQGSNDGQRRTAPKRTPSGEDDVGGAAMPVEDETTTEVEELGGSGQVDPISGLGLRNPVCDRPGQIRARKTRLSCQANGTPEGTYPASNYGFDIFIDSGLDAPEGQLAKSLVMILNGIWLGLAFVLKLVLALLGLAFGLNPFDDGQTMRQIAASLNRVYNSITGPWLSAMIVAGGIWFAYKGLLQRQFAAGVAGTLAGIAMLIVGLWVVHQPGASVGRLAKVTDEVAVTAISAPQSASLSRPMGTFAEAMSRTWSRLVEVPFAGLNFSDVEWALGPPPAEAVKRADEAFCDDVGTLALVAGLADLGNDEAAAACQHFAHRRYGRPRRVIDLYLRSSPGSPARKELWQYFDKDESDAYKAKVAAQGGDGVLTRLSMLALFALGLIGALMLLAWLAIRLFTQAAIAFVLLLAAPFAMFFPMLGESGRRAFKTWGLTLFGATVAKVVYAAFLSIVLLGMKILGSLGDATGFLLACAFAWSVFLKRAELVGWMSVGDVEGGRAISPITQIAAFALGRRLVKGPGGVVKGTGRRLGNGRQPGDEGPATRRTANESLGKGARGLADYRYREAQQTVAAYEARPAQAAAATSPGGRLGARQAAGSIPADRRPRSAAGRSGEVARQDAAARPGAAQRRGAGGRAEVRPGEDRNEAGPRGGDDARRYQHARELVDRVADNEARIGRRWSDRDLKRFAKEDRELLERSSNPADHAHRAGYERSQFERLEGEKRERAEKAIEKATKRDRQRLEVASETPGRVVRPRKATVHQHRERDERTAPERTAPERRAALQKRLRRDPHEVLHRARRHALSRGR